MQGAAMRAELSLTGIYGRAGKIARMSGEETPQPEPRVAPGRRFFSWRFLALALLIHAALLLIPVMESPSPRAPQRPLQLSLQPAPARLAEPVAPIVEEPPSPEPSDTVPEATSRPAPPSPPRLVTRTPAAPPSVEARHIRERLRDWTWSEPPASTPSIGRRENHDTYALLSRPLLPTVDNLFDDVVLPATAEIVDRWLEPGGTHHVVVRLPNGQVLCGRQEAVNVFRPWEQMPMMFGGCGGGGKR